MALILCLSPFFLAGLAKFFFMRQNSRHKLGGDISYVKSLWLCFALGAWFILPIFFYTRADETARILWLFHLLSWWIRGPFELMMIYRWLNWSPRYGISHNLFHMIGFSYFLFQSTAQGAEFAFALLLLFSFVMETLFAALFLKIRGDQKKTIYFASSSPEWRGVNQLTTFACVVVYTGLFAIGFSLLQNN